MYIDICVCVCVCVCRSERERAHERERARERARTGERAREQEDGIPRTDDHQGVKVQPVPLKAVILGGKDGWYPEPPSVTVTSTTAPPTTLI